MLQYQARADEIGRKGSRAFDKRMLNSEFSFRYHLTLIASTRQQTENVPRPMFIADCINKVLFFALHIICSILMHDNSSLYNFFSSYLLWTCVRQSFTADAMSFAYHIGDLMNYFKQQLLGLLLSPSSFSFQCQPYV